MLEKLIIKLERLQTRIEQIHQKRNRERNLRFAKTEITRLSRLRLL
jgi:transcription initiation factor TFIIIB Brf1 subunit/transcription initiation factor TFIIB